MWSAMHDQVHAVCEICLLVIACVAKGCDPQTQLIIIAASHRMERCELQRLQQEVGQPDAVKNPMIRRKGVGSDPARKSEITCGEAGGEPALGFSASVMVCVRWGAEMTSGDNVSIRGNHLAEGCSIVLRQSSIRCAWGCCRDRLEIREDICGGGDSTFGANWKSKGLAVAKRSESRGRSNPNKISLSEGILSDPEKIAAAKACGGLETSLGD
ncbi:hypothetical protein B0H17DRAFT_1128398 [Mycena rosella]|uniref:Uncharacterized protein n=1 Tax=Mycena rosella TaxID=1033263 RepID=A0AAD7DW34_MYCRO|nr:hypothetical protein B0H17DRAFT_1128398 [Mycena rosella]